jgi:hypothetical protein
LTLRREQNRRLSNGEIEDPAEERLEGKTVYEAAPMFAITRQTVEIANGRVRNPETLRKWWAWETWPGQTPCRERPRRA